MKLAIAGTRNPSENSLPLIEHLPDYETMDKASKRVNIIKI